jgi:iron uptake system component EfeO
MTAACAVALLAPMAACSVTESNKPSAKGGQGTINVESSADGCALSSTKAPSGNVVFKVKNTGSEVTEFYLYDEDGMRIVGEVENVGPGLSRDLVVRAAPGDYVTACKPGMKGQGIRDDFTVTDSGKDTSINGVDQATIDAATTQYAAYVKDQSQQLVDQTTEFTTLYKNGQDDEARKLFPHARGHWERIETVAESFGDLDPRMDLREADLEEGQKWTGWHRIEKDLWPPASGYQAMTDAERATFADDLLANTKVLDKRVQTLD